MYLAIDNRYCLLHPIDINPNVVCSNECYHADVKDPSNKGPPRTLPTVCRRDTLQQERKLAPATWGSKTYIPVLPFLQEEQCRGWKAGGKAVSSQSELCRTWEVGPGSGVRHGVGMVAFLQGLSISASVWSAHSCIDMLKKPAGKAHCRLKRAGMGKKASAAQSNFSHHLEASSAAHSSSLLQLKPQSTLPPPSYPSHLSPPPSNLSGCYSQSNAMSG